MPDLEGADHFAKGGFEEFPQVNHLAAGSSENSHRYGKTILSSTAINGHERYQTPVDDFDAGAAPQLPYLASGEFLSFSTCIFRSLANDIQERWNVA